MAASCSFASARAYWSAFFEQSEKSTGARIFLIRNGDLLAGLLAASSCSSLLDTSSTTAPEFLPGFAFIMILSCRWIFDHLIFRSASFSRPRSFFTHQYGSSKEIGPPPVCEGVLISCPYLTVVFASAMIRVRLQLAYCPKDD